MSTRTVSHPPRRRPPWYTRPVPRQPVERLSFLLDRARYRIIQQAHQDLCLFEDALDASLRSGDSVLERWRETFTLLEQDLALVLALVCKLDERVSRALTEKLEALLKAHTAPPASGAA